MNEYILNDSFEFANDTTNQSSNYFMASLLTNVRLDETVDELLKSEMTVSGLN